MNPWKPNPWDPSYIGIEFERASHGYLTTPANRLSMIFADLPPSGTPRERSIEAAIAWGVRHPVQWDTMRMPLKFTVRPKHALGTQDGWR